MLRTFNESELDNMCRRRPAVYRLDVLAVAVKRPDGLYEVDTDSAAFQALRYKYLPKTSQFDPKVRQVMERQRINRSAGDTSGLRAVNHEEVYVKARELIAILGVGCAFATAYESFIELEKRGVCRSCSRRGQLQKLMSGLRASIMAAPVDIRQKVRAVFAATVFFEVVPAPVKWDDLMK